MHAARGAGQRIVNQFDAGQIHFDSQNHCFRNHNDQDFFFTTHGRTLRYDRVADQYNVYDARSSEFVPCDGLRTGEFAEPITDPRDLFRLLIDAETWTDFFVDRGTKFATGAGKQVLYGAAAGLTASVVAPYVSKGISAGLDALKKPVEHLTHSAVHAKTHAVVNAKVNAALHAKAAVARTIPDLPPFPDVFPPPWRPNGPCPFPPTIPWWRNWASMGTIGAGAGIGMLTFGPIGAFAGSVLGAGAGSAMGG
jgi:hypothetical protein